MARSGYAAYQAKNQPRSPDVSTMIAEMGRLRLAEMEGRRIPLLPWALKVPEAKTGTLDFDRYPFQRELYSEAGAEIETVVKKATQVGISAYLVRWTMYWADTRGLTALYVFPKLKQMYDFSDARIKAVIMASEYLRERIPGMHVQNKGLKQVGLGFVYYRGSESTDDLQSVDADVLALDEYDDLQNIDDAERRIGGSQYGYIRRVGVPYFPGQGISDLYTKSDQRRWNIKCGACGEWQDLTFSDNVDLTAATIICRRCAKPLDVRRGEWVAAYPDRPTRGYHVSKLIAPSTDLVRVIANSKKRNPMARQVFHNKDLGEDYAAEEGRLSPEAIAAAQSAGGGYVLAPGYVGDNLVTMGVDVASARALNVRISEHYAPNKKRALALREVDDYNELALLMDRFQVRMACIDHLPETRLSRAFAERFPGRVYLVSYNTSPLVKDSQAIKVDHDMRHVSLRRVEGIDAMMEMIRQQRNQLPLDPPEGYVDHLKNVLRVVEKDELGKQTVAYRSTGDDDFAHAEVYDVAATELYYMRQGLAEYESEVYTRLEDHLEFERSGLADGTGPEPDYMPGGFDDGYYEGFGS